MKQPRRLVICGLAVVSVLAGGVAVADAASTSVVAAGPASCFDRVIEQRYTRPTTVTEFEYGRSVPKFTTQVEIRKQTRTRENAEAEWSSWSDYPIVTWDDGRARSGFLGPDWEYRYIETGESRELPDGTTTERQWFTSNPGGSWTPTGQTRTAPGPSEDSGWVTSAPSGDGWELVDTREVDGQQTSCEERPDDGVETRSTDGICQRGDDIVTIEHFSTPYTFVLDGNFEWLKVLGEEVQLESTTRTLTAAEQVDCMPVRENRVVRVDGTFECNDTTVEQRTTTTSFTYDYEGGVWVESSTVAVTSSVRQLADDERTVCSSTTTTTPDDGVTTTTVSGPTTTNPVAGDGGTVPPRPDETTTTVAPAPATTNPVAGDGGTVPPRTPTGGLPATGGSASSGMLQLGALLLLAGFAAFVIARRRDSTESA